MSVPSGAGKWLKNYLSTGDELRPPARPQGSLFLGEHPFGSLSQESDAFIVSTSDRTGPQTPWQMGTPPLHSPEMMLR